MVLASRVWGVMTMRGRARASTEKGVRPWLWRFELSREMIFRKCVRSVSATFVVVQTATIALNFGFFSFVSGKRTQRTSSKPVIYPR